MTLRFSDGIDVDTSGPYRKLRLRDGWYVTGNGLLSPCDDEADADRFLAELTPPTGRAVAFKDIPNGTQFHLNAACTGPGAFKCQDGRSTPLDQPLPDTIFYLKP